MRRIRRTMLVFSVLGNTDAWEVRRRISRPDMGFGMMPLMLPSTTETGSGRCDRISLIVHLLVRFGSEWPKPLLMYR